MTKLRGAVIGAGYFSRFHHDAWARIDEVEIVACCDLEESKARRIADEHGIGAVYRDLRVLLDAERVDFVDVVTRPDSHLAICQEVAQRGLPMICQKPLAPTAEQGKQLVEAVEAAGVRFTQRHFVECLLSGASFETDGRSYLRSIAVQEAAYRSSQTGRSEVPV